MREHVWPEHTVLVKDACDMMCHLSDVFESYSLKFGAAYVSLTLFLALVQWLRNGFVGIL